MRPPQRTLRRVRALALIALQPFMLASCEGGPTQSLDSEAGASTMLNQYHYAKTVTITLPDSTLLPGRKVQLSAEVRDQDGLVVSWAPVTWSTGDSEIVTVSSSGLITAGDKIGTTTVSAFSDGVTATRTLSVDPPWDGAQSSGDDSDADDSDADDSDSDNDSDSDGSDSTATPDDGPDSEGTDSVTTPAASPVHMISISANATTLKVGETTQIAGVVRDVNGTPVPDVAVSWSTSQASVATVVSTSLTAGLLTASGVGTSTVFAKADTVVRSITLTVIDSATAPAPSPSAPVPAGGSGGSYGSAAAAELPRASVNTAYPTANRQVRVPAGGNLQAAIDAAQAGDELLLAPGAV